MRLRLLLFSAAAVATAAAFFSATMRLGFLAAIGRSPVCPFAEALKSADNLKTLISIKDRILRESHLERTDEKDGLELWSTPKGTFWIPAHNRYTLPFNLAEMERKVYGSGDQFIHPFDVVLDCGASDGDFTREALRAGAKLVVAIEVTPQSIECLRRNLAREISDGRVIVYPKGVWDKEDSLTLNIVDENFAANSVVTKPEGSHRSVTVPLTTIDRIVAELKLQRVDFIKMDVEGAEARAITGAHDTLNHYKPRMAITTEHNLEDEIVIPRTIRQVRSDYRMQCGPCMEENGRIRADVLYFY